MKSFIALALAAVATAVESEDTFHFMQYIAEYQKNYVNVYEYQFRFENWLNANKAIVEHNAKESSYKMGHNQFSDWSPAEWDAFLTHKETAPATNNNQEIFAANSVPIDWRKLNAVTPVKNQGSCGSCWTFSATGALEGAVAKKTGTLHSYAEQQLVDCDTGSSGCNGGSATQAFDYWKTTTAVLEANYPYKAVQGTCLNGSVTHTSVKTLGYTGVTASDPVAMKAGVAIQPLKVSIRASDASFQQYKSGIYNNTACGT